MLLSITTLGHDLFCEFVCFLRCVHRVSWNDPSTYVCGRHILDVTLFCIAIIYCMKTSVQNPIDLFLWVYAMF